VVRLVYIREENTMSDTISTNRGLPVVEVSSIPTPPEAFKPSTVSDSQGLRKLADKVEAEAILAVEECELLGEQLNKDLGNDVPSTKSLAELKARKKQIIASKARLLYLVQYLEELDDIANNDLVLALDAITDEFEHSVKKRPHLAESYSALQKYAKSHGDSVREGIARAKKKEETK
jgi:hypothetical protein